MKFMFRILFVFSLIPSVHSFAQEPFPYWNEVQQLKQKDSLAFPSSGQILFIGSSSFTRWKDVQKYFPGYSVLNRAFGGSTLADLIRYRYDVIYPYQPRQIVMYCGENDFASSDTVTVEIVLQRFQTLFKLIRFRYPEVPFTYVSMKPSPSRKRLHPKYEEANSRIQSFLKKYSRTSFVDVYHSMLQKDGSPKAGLFVQDSLHMNANGYAIWKKLIQPYLKKK